jgi:hypothetical protein
LGSASQIGSTSGPSKSPAPSHPQHQTKGTETKKEEGKRRRGQDENKVNTVERTVTDKISENERDREKTDHKVVLDGK